MFRCSRPQFRHLRSGALRLPTLVVFTWANVPLRASPLYHFSHRHPALSSPPFGRLLRALSGGCAFATIGRLHSLSCASVVYCAFGAGGLLRRPWSVPVLGGTASLRRSCFVGATPPGFALPHTPALPPVGRGLRFASA